MGIQYSTKYIIIHTLGYFLSSNVEFEDYMYMFCWGFECLYFTFKGKRVSWGFDDSS
jgi:hypothetical protein